jgi:hypothetical protein
MFEDLGERERERADAGDDEKRRPAAQCMSPTRQARETREDDQAAAEREPALQRDQAADVARVALAEVGRDLVVNGADLAAERVDLGLAERKGQGAFIACSSAVGRITAPARRRRPRRRRSLHPLTGRVEAPRRSRTQPDCSMTSQL